jgi:hypothetical protein
MRDNRGLISLFYPEKKQQPNLNSWYYFIFLFHLREFIILFFSFVQFLIDLSMNPEAGTCIFLENDVSVIIRLGKYEKH